MEVVEQPICQFYRLIPGAPDPQPADRSADGKIPVEAYRYCEPLAAASGFGFYIFPPISFRLLLDDDEVMCGFEGSDDWYALDGIQYPGFREYFEEIAPSELAELAPPFLVRGSQPGNVQIWSGFLARTAPGWALLSRGVANIAKTVPYRNFEGILETDTWFGPLFTNIRLTRTNSPVHFHTRRPMFQVQPLRRESYTKPPFEVLEAADMRPDDWGSFEATITPNTDHHRSLGHYAVATRKRLRSSSTS